MRDEFLSIASHELRTPLTSLQLQVQALLRRLGRSQRHRRVHRLDHRTDRQRRSGSGRPACPRLIEQPAGHLAHHLRAARAGRRGLRPVGDWCARSWPPRGAAGRRRVHGHASTPPTRCRAAGTAAAGAGADQPARPTPASTAGGSRSRSRWAATAPGAGSRCATRASASIPRTGSGSSSASSARSRAATTAASAWACGSSAEIVEADGRRHHRRERARPGGAVPGHPALAPPGPGRCRGGQPMNRRPRPRTPR